MRGVSRRALAMLLALGAGALWLEPTATRAADEDEASAYSWDRTEAGLDFTTEVRGRRIPDYLRDLLEDARQVRPDVQDGPPPPTTLSQLRRRAAEDAKRLEEVLASEAYYNGSVAHSVRQAAGGSFEVVYFVILGERSMIRNFDIVYSGHPEGGEGLPRTGAELGLEPGKAARAERIIELTGEAVRRLHNNGYPNGKLDRRRVTVNLTSSEADVTLYMTAGERYRFGPVLVTNEGRTDPDYVRQLTTFEGGEVYDRSEVDKTTEALRDTGLFSGISISSAEPEDGTLPQRIELTERAPRTVRLGARWSSSEGPGVRGSWEHRNLFGRAERLTLGLTIAQILQAATADFRKPDFLRPDQSLLASFEIAHEESDAYDENRVKTGVSLERVLSERWTGTAGVTFQVTETEDSNGRITYQLFGVPVTLRYDSSNDLLNPTEGIRATLGATPYFGSSDGRPTTFTKLEASGATYLSLADELVLALRGRYGLIAAEETVDVPGSTRFYAGGGGSVRGYGYQMAGPLDAQGDPTGGRSVLEANVEARYRATETIGLVAFIDGGQAFENMTPSLGDPLLWGAGLGVRYYTPIGPVRADVAIPLNKRQGVDDDFQIYVSLGQAF
ncbi:surface antigen (D15) [Parvibaculum lavamentivorans DS-1]|uniref:Surface antigen (D15) n=1 Tax=Parvibaculum lavamentivorans (strain DS-1 / DSM 13023 / NCIMB 13966) TaxID=402881 RepID=A7HQ24_PARL1|nr:autotransporter assembly complex family protein [Parvibaculum lavamentivorans]ABS62007.1 surface antigen (D15) [Parvibaculum lavamentivorans DS-1]